MNDDSRTALKALIFAVAVLISFAVYFHGLGDYGFIDPDEGRYSEIPREMIETGDFITPRLNYVKYFEKPPLHYWLTAASFKIFGENEFSGRLFPVLSGLGCCVLAYVLALKVTKSRYAAELSGLMLSSSVLWYAASRINLTDMTLTFFFTASMTCYYLWSTENKKLMLLLFYAFMAFAVLTKGLIGVVLPGGIALIHLIITKQYKKIAPLFSPRAILLFLVIVLPYFIAVCRKNPDFFEFFFIREHFLRYTTTIHARYEPFWFFIPIIIAGFIPWAGMIWDSMRAVFGKCKIIDRDSGLFLGLWFFMPLAFFSCSGSKLITYILPCIPPLAVLTGASMSVFEGKDFRRFIIISTIIIIPVAAAGLILPLIKADPDYNAMAFPAMCLSLTLLTFWAVSLFIGRSKIIPLVLCVIAALAMYSASGAFIVEGKLLSRKDSAALIPSDTDDVVVYQNLMQGMSWYTKRRTVTADALNELEFGAAQEKDPKWFINNDDLKKLWNSSRKVIVSSRRKDNDSNALGLREVLGTAPVREWVTSADIVFANF